MNVLVTGGAGYIGSAAVKMLIEDGHTVTIIDNMSKGQERLIHQEAEFHKIDLTDKETLKSVFNKKYDAIIHFAGYKAAGESMKNAPKYSQNIVGTINLLDCMVENKVPKIIFSSSAAVYGEPERGTIDENHPTVPVNYYGFGKLACEQIIEWYAKIHAINFVNLRYFNVIGDVGLQYKDPAPENILPIIDQVINGEREHLTIFGDDYPTRDGTCIRDYIELRDLVHAHILALQLNSSEIINLGTGTGMTVLELIKKIETERNVTIPYRIGQRRPGDPAALKASNEKAKKMLHWSPQ